MNAEHLFARLPSPVSGQAPSILHPLSCILHSPRSIVNRPVSAFHPSILPNSINNPCLCSSKRKFKKSIEEQMSTPLFLPQMAVPKLEKGRIECYLLRIVLEQFATPSRDGAHLSCPSQLSIVHPSILRGRFATFKHSDVQTFKDFHPPIFPSPIIRGPLSTSSLQPKRSGATFNRWHLILQKLNSNNKSEQFPVPPLFPPICP
jgi:hypothetical protein